MIGVIDSQDSFPAGFALAVEDIDHTRTKNPQTNGICERFHRTVLDEFYRVAFRKKIYRTIDEVQRDLDAWVKEYNETRPHQGRWCYGKTPLQTFLDALPIAREKLLPARNAGHRIFVGHPPRRRAKRQVKCILLHLRKLARRISWMLLTAGKTIVKGIRLLVWLSVRYPLRCCI